MHAIGGSEDHGVAEHPPTTIKLDDIAAMLGTKSARGGRHDGKLDVGALLDRLEQTLAHIFAEQLARQKCVRERLMEAGMIFALIELAEGPVQEIAGLACANREIAGAHVEEVQGVVATIGDAASEHGRGLDDQQAKRLGEVRKASDRARCSCESSTDNADGEWRCPHLSQSSLVLNLPAQGLTQEWGGNEAVRYSTTISLSENLSRARAAVSCRSACQRPKRIGALRLERATRRSLLVFVPRPSRGATR